MSQALILFYFIFAMLLSSCGKESLIEKLKGGPTGDVPGKFTVKLSEKGVTKAIDLENKFKSISSGSSLTKRFSDADETTLTANSALSKIYSLDFPDTGSSALNAELFKQIQKYTSDENAYLESVDTDKNMAGDFLNYASTNTYNDTKYADQYYLEMIRWQEARKLLTTTKIDNAAPVLVAVVDTGVDSSHEDLKDVMYKNSSGVAVGYDAFSKAEVNSPTDNHYHGTHVAGIIAGTGDNSKGIYGVGYMKRSSGDPVVKILSAISLDKDGAGTTRESSHAIQWAVKKMKQEKAKNSKQKLIVNMSLGGPFETDGYDYKKDSEGRFKDETFQYAAEQDALIFVAAGNESCEIGSSCKIGGKSFSEAYYYPCSYANVVCVAASTHEEKLAGFSNRKNSVELIAPGWLIASTVPNSYDTDNYESLNGTSMATPVASGAAAMLWAIYPDFTATEIAQILKNSSSKINNMNSETVSKAGRLDLKAAFDYAETLKTQGKKPSQLAATTNNSPVTPSKTPTSDQDPNSKSSKIDGESSTEGGGCGVVKKNANENSSRTPYLLFWMMLLPLAVLFRNFWIRSFV